MIHPVMACITENNVNTSHSRYKHAKQLLHLRAIDCRRYDSVHNLRDDESILNPFLTL